MRRHLAAAVALARTGVGRDECRSTQVRLWAGGEGAQRTTPRLDAGAGTSMLTRMQPPSERSGS